MKKLILVLILGGVVYGGYALVSKRSGEPVPTPSETPDVVSGIKGRWISQDDDRSVMVLSEEGTFEDFYDGASVGRGTWELEVNTLVKRVDGDELTYTVLELSPYDLTLSYNARGNTLRYTRVVELE